MIQQTSIDAYYENVESLGRWQREVLDAFMRIGFPATDSEVIKANNLGNRMQPRARRNELVKKGLLRCAGRRPCLVTRRSALVWEPTK